MSQKKMGITDSNLVKAMTAMGGGIVSRGGACGAVTGAVAFLGSLLGRDQPEEKDDPVLWKACREFYDRFQREVAEKYGSVNCRDITGVDWDDRDQVKAFRKGEGVIECQKNTGKAARILGEVLEKYLEGKASR